MKNIIFLLLYLTTSCTASRKLSRDNFYSSYEGVFSTIDEQHDINNKLDFWLIKSSKDKIKIVQKTGINHTDAMSWLDNQKFLIENLYEPHRVSYPGLLSENSACLKYAPQKVESESDKSIKIKFYLKSNKRLVYGVCNDDLIFYDSLTILSYCKKNNTIIKFSLFTPLHNGTNLQEIDIYCK